MDINNYNNYRPNNYQTNMNQNPKIISDKNLFNQHSKFGDLNNAFKQNQPFIESPIQTNFNNTLHNNLHPSLLLENIVEYYLHIDSEDRSLDIYPDPYNFVVSLKPIGKSIDRRFKIKNKGVDFETTEYPETTGPVIIRNFKNIKYVKLDRVIFSKLSILKFVINQDIEIDEYNNITVKTEIDHSCCNKDEHKKCSVCLCESCQCYLNDRFKYIILKIKELETRHIYSTNTQSSDNTFILINDRTLGNSHSVWIPTYSSCTYPITLLHNLERLTIEFFDKGGKKLSPHIILEYNINIKYAGKTYNYTYCLLFGEFDKCIRKKLCHKYNNLYSFNFIDLCKYDKWFEKMQKMK